MSKNVENLLKAFMSLNNAEKNQVINLVKQIGLSSDSRTRDIFEMAGLKSLGTTINFAPTPGTCPAFGK